MQHVPALKSMKQVLAVQLLKSERQSRSIGDVLQLRRCRVLRRNRYQST